MKQEQLSIGFIKKSLDNLILQGTRFDEGTTVLIDQDSKDNINKTRDYLKTLEHDDPIHKELKKEYDFDKIENYYYVLALYLR